MLGFTALKAAVLRLASGLDALAQTCETVNAHARERLNLEEAQAAPANRIAALPTEPDPEEPSNGKRKTRA